MRSFISINCTLVAIVPTHSIHLGFQTFSPTFNTGIYKYIFFSYQHVPDYRYDSGPNIPLYDSGPKSQQIVNRIENHREVCTKSGLAQNLAKLMRKVSNICIIWGLLMDIQLTFGGVRNEIVTRYIFTNVMMVYLTVLCMLHRGGRSLTPGSPRPMWLRRLSGETLLLSREHTISIVKVMRNRSNILNACCRFR